MKTSNAFIARQCDQADEVTELDACIASGQVSAGQVEAHWVAGDFVKPVQPASEQPVAWLAKRGFLIPGDVISTCQYDRKDAWQKKYYEPLYAIARPVQPAPAHWIRLSDDERDELCKHWNDNALQLCMDVQAVLKFKNAAPQGTPAQSAPQLDQLEPHLTGRWHHGSTS